MFLLRGRARRVASECKTQTLATLPVGIVVFRTTQSTTNFIAYGLLTTMTTSTARTVVISQAHVPSFVPVRDLLGHNN